ncbi:MAG TPA: hypothetical protein VMA09_08300 [Candidatus Binataceae bacterium]|nr:hypothetical protein [Candidatus Binataceae bacterium]
MGSGTKTFIVTLAGIGVLFLLAAYQADANSTSAHDFGAMVGHALFRCIVAGIVTGLVASWLDWSWGGIIVLFVIVLVVISNALNHAIDARTASAASVDGEWVGRGERTVCGNSQGTVDVSITVSTQAKQAGCPDCLPTTYASLNVNGESSNQLVNVAENGAMNSGLNNIGSGQSSSWFVALTRSGGPFHGYQLSGVLERMNFDCRNLGTTGDKVSVQLHRP